MTLQGVDLSSYNGPPGTWQQAAGDITWAAVKLTELGVGGSRYVSPDAAADWAFLKQHGKGRIAYCFGHPSVSPDETVSFFASEVAKVGLEDADAVALDLESNDINVSPAAVAEWACDVQAALEVDYDRVPLLYTFRNFAAEGNCAGLAKYPLWISDPSDAAGQPQVPAPWTGWAIHQHSTSGAIDRDVANYATLDAMQDALGRRAPRKVIHWHVNGIVTLAGVAERHHTTPQVMLRLARREHHVYRPEMQRYIERRDWHAHLPLEVELFAYET